MSMNSVYPVIDPVATGANIKRLRIQRGMRVQEVQHWFNFEEPRAIYKWEKGQTLPSVDNLVALGELFDVMVDDIVIRKTRRMLMKEPERTGSVFLRFFGKLVGWNCQFLFMCGDIC